MRTKTMHQAACPQLMRQLTSLGLPAAALAAEAGLRAIHLRGEERAPLAAMLQLKGLAARRMGEPHLGFRLAAATRVDDLEAYGAALLHAPTIGDALAVGIEFLPVWSEGLHLTMTRAATSVSITCECAPIDDPLGAQIELQQTLLFLIDLLRRFGGEAATPRRICCACPAPRGRFPVPGVGELPWRFDAPVWALELRKDVLAAPLGTIHPALPRVLRKHLEREREALGDVPDLLARLEEAIGRGLERGWSQDDVAASLGMSVRTLQKQLRAARTSYSAKLLEVRMALSTSLLRDGKHTVEEVGRRVGFASQAGFSRFFTAQAGVAPSRFRRRT